MFRSLLLASAGLASAQQVFGAEPKDLAELFPSGTLVYAEIGQPAATSDAIAEFVKGTLLADNLAHSHDRRDKMQPPGALAGLKRVGESSALVSPEMLADFKKFKGVAAGLTGFDAKTGRPSLAVAFVLGESQLAGFLVRQYLLSAPNIRRVGKIEGIGVYQNRGLTGSVIDENNKPEPILDPAPAQGMCEPTYFYAPGLFVIGSNVNAVRDVYRRFAGTEKSAGFSTAPVLKPYAEARKKPGLFFCVDAAVLDAQLIAAKKVSNADWHKSPAISYIRFLLNPKQVESVAGSLQLQPDGWELAATAEVKAGGSCPLLALLSGGEASLAEADADSAALQMAFPAKEKRAKAILDAADAIGRALGQAGGLPSELVAEAEKGGFKFAADWLPLVRSATVLQPKVATGPKAKPAYAVVVLTLEDDAAAKGWLGIVPRVSQLFSGAEMLPDPASETIQNVKVWGLVHDSTPVHYAVTGNRLILSRDRDAVAATVNAPATPGPKVDGEPALLFRMAFSKAWGLLPVEWQGRSHLVGVENPEQAKEVERHEKLQNFPLPVIADVTGTIDKEWTKALAAMPALTFQAKGTGQTLTMRFVQKNLKKPLAKWLELLWQNVEQAPENGGDGRIQGGILQLEDPIPIQGRGAATRDKMLHRYGD